MQEVCRLKRATIEMLTPYGDDPNVAIEALWSHARGLEVSLDKERAVTKALQDCNKSVTSCNNSVTTPMTAREKFMSTPVPDQGLPVQFNDAYWKRLRDEVGKSLEPYIGRV